MKFKLLTITNMVSGGKGRRFSLRRLRWTLRDPIMTRSRTRFWIRRYKRNTRKACGNPSNELAL